MLCVIATALLSQPWPYQNLLVGVSGSASPSLSSSPSDLNRLYYQVQDYQAGGGSNTIMTEPKAAALKHSDIYVPPDLNAMTADARSWYLKGVSSAELNLNSFETIANGLKKGENINPILKTQLGSLLDQVTEANSNTKTLVPTLTGFVNDLYGWTRDPGWLDKLKLKAAIYYVNGKRDNKSYYLLNGAALWNKLRVDKYLKGISGKPAEDLTADLNKFEDQILTARDSLDDAAQEYVKGIGKLVNLVCDIGKNAKEMKSVVDKMKSEMDKVSGDILKTSQDSVDNIQKKINELK